MKVTTDLDVRGALTVAGLPIAAGSTILSGTATPTGATGNVGDYYLDTDDRVLYGPKVGSYGLNQSAFTTQTPNASSSGGPSAQGGELTFAVAGRITALMFYRHASAVSTSRTFRLWNTTSSTQMASAATSGESGSGWFTATLATPVDVTAGQKVRVTAETPTYEAIAYGGTKVIPVVNGDVTYNQSYWGSTNSYPTTVESLQHFVDVVFQKANTTPWPVAVYGVPPGGTTGQVLGKTSGTDYAVSYGDYWKSWSGNQAAYDALGTYDARTLYVVTP